MATSGDLKLAIDRDFDPLQPDRTITLREALPTLEEAESEAKRLNALKDQSCVKYFTMPVTWFPDGRDVQVGY